LRTGQGGQARIKLTVKGGLSWFALGLARQRRLQTLLDKALLEVLDRARGYTQSPRHIGHFPGIAKLTRVTQQQGAGVNELCRGRFAAAGQFGELLAFPFRQGDFVSIGHAGAKPGSGSLSIRNYIRYVILESYNIFIRLIQTTNAASVASGSSREAIP